VPRLLNLCPTPGTVGGVARIAAYTGALLERRGWTVRTLFSGGSDRYILDEWSAEYDTPLDIDDRFFSEVQRYSARDLRALRTLFREWPADAAIIHFGNQSIAPRLVAGVRAAGISRCVAYCHAAYPWKEWGDRGPRVARSTRLASRLCVAVIASSDAVAKEVLAGGVRPGKVSVINTGVRLATRFSDRATAREHLGLPSDAFVVGAVLRFVPEKAPHVLVAAVAALSGEPLLVVQGEGELKPDIEALAEARLGGRATFFDKYSDVSALYTASDVVALTSLNEGFPLVLQEAAAHSRPTVATDVGGVSQLVIDGQTGFVVPPGSPDPVTNALEKLRADADLRARMGEAARVRAESQFSDEITAHRVDELLRRCL
jgi:glycosyltransferase involved in cell wall biosynthesis